MARGHGRSCWCPAGQYYDEPATAAPLRPSPVRALRPQAAPRPRLEHQQQYFENSFSAPAAAGRPSAIPNNFAQFTQSTNFASPAPPRPLAAPRFASPLGPVPARAQISGAAPAGPAPSPYRPLAPAPVRESHLSPQPQALFVPQSQLPGLGQHYSQPAPALPRRPSPPGGGLLDQLARDYALPQNAAQPLVDTSFGFY